MYLISAPATKAFSPAPVRITTRVSSSPGSSSRAVAELSQGCDVESVQRLLPVDRDDGDAVFALDLDQPGTLPLRKSTISLVERRG